MRAKKCGGIKKSLVKGIDKINKPKTTKGK